MNQLVNLPAPQYLRTLTLHSVKLTEAEIAPIYNFSGLLSLQLVVVRGRAFQNLSRLVSLRSLTTWNCEWVNSDVLMQIGKLERLEHLTLNCCDQINDEGLKHLSALTNLLSLGLTDLTCISEVGLRHLSTLTNLSALTLAYNPVSDEMVHVIAEHHTEKLQVLDLDAASLGEGLLTDRGLLALGKLTKLRRLKLAYHSFTPNGLSSLSGLTNLETLSLESVEGCVTGDSLKSLSKLVHLRKLNLDSCPTFEDDAMSALAHFTELEHLNIAKTMFKRGLQYLSSATHPKLTYLDCSFSEKLDDAGLRYITRLTNLGSLHLFRCPKGHLTTKGTRALLDLKKLEVLDVRECPIAKDVAKILRGRIKDMREDLGNLNSAPLPNNLEDSDAPENEELPDSDDESMVMITQFQPFQGGQPHSYSHPILDPVLSYQQLQQVQETQYRHYQDPLMYISDQPHATTVHMDDLMNYQLSDSDDFENEIMPGEDEDDPSSASFMSIDDEDEVEDHAEAKDRNLLAALFSQRSRPQIPHNKGQTTKPPSFASSVIIPGDPNDFEPEDIED